MKKQNIYIFIAVLSIMISIISLSYTITFNRTKKEENVWCSKNFLKSSIKGIITGEIIEVKKGDKNSRANIIIQDNNENTVIYHDSNIEFKIGQEIKVEHSGVSYSIPPQATAICIDIIRDNPVNLGEPSNIEVSDKVVSIRIKDETLTDSKVTLILENHTNGGYSYGNPYSIQYEHNRVWYEIIPLNDLNFNLPAFNLKGKESIEININWEYHYGRLTKGKYRIIKDVFKESNGPTKDKDIYIAAEFIID